MVPKEVNAAQLNEWGAEKIDNIKKTTAEAKGKIISGQFGKLIARQKAGHSLEIGELLIAEQEVKTTETSKVESKILLQVCDLMYGSQISLQNLELVAGMGLEEDASMEFMDKELRNYNLAVLKALMEIRKKENSEEAVLCKQLPLFFSELRQPNSDDFGFLSRPKNPLLFGKLRSGTKALDFDVFLDAESVLSHHILISATTGRGKSNLCSVLLWNICETDCAGVLVLDPHDEYYGRNRLGLKDHPKNSENGLQEETFSRKVIYYTASDVPMGCRTLKLNASVLRPSHFNGVFDWSDAQSDVINAYHRQYDSSWVEAILLEKSLGSNIKLNEASIAVVRRRLLALLDMRVVEGNRIMGNIMENKIVGGSAGKNIFCNGVFDTALGKSTVKDIISELESGKVVIIDTSPFSGNIELLIGSVICSEALYKYKKYKSSGELNDKPLISIVIEEAPRVLGKEIIEKGPNVFSSIAREGRKFRIGLVAVTQLPSLIPRQILANINTKIIMGTEMKPERQALIESAAQDLSDDDRNIASLDRGEAIITSNFAKFAMPVRIPLFEEYAKLSLQQNRSAQLNINQKKLTRSFQGISFE